MSLQNLSEVEIKEINGGTEESYSLGYSIGSHLRASIKATGDFIGGIIDMISPFTWLIIIKILNIVAPFVNRGDLIIRYSITKIEQSRTWKN